MALDEPHEEDEKIAVGACTFVMAPDVAQMVAQYGGVKIDFVDEPHRRGYVIDLGRRGGCC
jgi:hypothetical protein